MNGVNEKSLQGRMFIALINNLNATIQNMNAAGLRIYDSIDTDYALSGVHFDVGKDEVVFDCEEVRR